MAAGSEAACNRVAGTSPVAAEAAREELSNRSVTDSAEARAVPWAWSPDAAEAACEGPGPRTSPALMLGSRGGLFNEPLRDAAEAARQRVPGEQAPKVQSSTWAHRGPLVEGGLDAAVAARSCPFSELTPTLAHTPPSTCRAPCRLCLATCLQISISACPWSSRVPSLGLLPVSGRRSFALGRLDLCSALLPSFVSPPCAAAKRSVPPALLPSWGWGSSSSCSEEPRLEEFPERPHSLLELGDGEKVGELDWLPRDLPPRTAQAASDDSGEEAPLMSHPGLFVNCCAASSASPRAP